MLGDEIGERVVSIAFRCTGNLTTSALKKIGHGALNHFKKVKTTITDQGKQSISHLAQNQSQLQGIEVAKSEIAGFEHYAKKYRLDYSLVRQKNDPSQYAFFFRAKDISKMELAMKDFVNDKTLDNNTLTEKITAAREKALSINQARAQERQPKGRKKSQRSEPQL